MDIYQYIRKEAEQREIRIRDPQVSAIAGVLLSIGFPKAMGRRDQIGARPIVAEKLNRIVGAEPGLKKAANKTRTAETLEAATNEESFTLINELVRSNKCPKCSGALTTADLDNYETIKYCKECRLAIWDDDGDGGDA